MSIINTRGAALHISLDCSPGLWPPSKGCLEDVGRVIRGLISCYGGIFPVRGRTSGPYYDTAGLLVLPETNL